MKQINMDQVQQRLKNGHTIDHETLMRVSTEQYQRQQDSLLFSKYYDGLRASMQHLLDAEAANGIDAARSIGLMHSAVEAMGECLSLLAGRTMNVPKEQVAQAVQRARRIGEVIFQNTWTGMLKQVAKPSGIVGPDGNPLPR